jgi:hypothetical protein
MNQYPMMNVNQMSAPNPAMDYALQHLPPHILQHVPPAVPPGAPGARPPAKEAREKKDKNAPKRNWSAYQFYVEEVG